MKKTTLILILFFVTGFIAAEKVATLTEVMKPGTLVIDDNQFYVTEKTTVFIYSLSDFKFKKKFGKDGEGPQEFKVRGAGTVEVIPQPDYLQINSERKVSFFTKDGSFQREIKGTSLIGIYRPLGKQFVGYGYARNKEEQKDYFTFNIYDSNLKKVKEIHREDRGVVRGGKINAVAATSIPILHTFKNKTYVNNIGGQILTFDENGKKLITFNTKSEKDKVTDARKEKYINFFKTDPRTRGQYEALKNRIEFPEYFPMIRDYRIADDKIYVLTYTEKGDNKELLIFDLKGKLIKKVMYPFLEINVLEIFPFDIKNGKLYQIIENEDEEEWELHISEII